MCACAEGADFFFLSNHLGFLADYMGEGGTCKLLQRKSEKNLLLHGGGGTEKRLVILHNKWTAPYVSG